MVHFRKKCYWYLLGFQQTFLCIKGRLKHFSIKKVSKFDRFSRRWMILLFCFLQPKNILVSIPHTFHPQVCLRLTGAIFLRRFRLYMLSFMFRFMFANICFEKNQNSKIHVMFIINITWNETWNNQVLPFASLVC